MKGKNSDTRREWDGEYRELFRDKRSGKYYFRKHIIEVGGAKEISLKTTKRSEAIRIMNRMLSDFQRFTEKREIHTVDKAVNELLEIYQGQSKATFENFEYYSRAYILPYFSGQDVMSIKRNWKAFKSYTKVKKPGMYLDHLRKHCSRILSHSYDQGWIEGLPKLKLDPQESSQNEPEAYDIRAVQKLFNTKFGKKFKPKTVEKVRLFTKLVLFTGLRPPSEINNLKYDYFDFKNHLLRLPEGYGKMKKPRNVPIPKELITEIKNWKTSQMPLESIYLFPKRHHPNLPATRSDRSWQRVKRALNWKGSRYEFRHTHATTVIEAGESPIVVAKDMGTSVEMLSKIYVKPSKDTIERRAKIVKRKFANLKH